MLADAAQALDNKLYILGGGWSIAGPEPTPSAIALHLMVPWEEANKRHLLRLELLDGDAKTVTIGEEPLAFETQFEVGRAPGLVEGTPIDLSLAISMGPIPLPPAGLFEWRLSIDGDSHPDWRVAFRTRPRPEQEGERPG
jgi:hypothetical protein